MANCSCIFYPLRCTKPVSSLPVFIIYSLSTGLLVCIFTLAHDVTPRVPKLFEALGMGLEGGALADPGCGPVRAQRFRV